MDFALGVFGATRSYSLLLRRLEAMERFLWLMIAARCLNATGLGLLFSASTDLLYDLVPQVIGLLSGPV